MPVFGLNNGITPIIAYNYGARHRKRMLKTVKVSMFIAFCFTFIGFLAFEFIPKHCWGCSVLPKICLPSESLHFVS